MTRKFLRHDAKGEFVQSCHGYLPSLGVRVDGTGLHNLFQLFLFIEVSIWRSSVLPCGLIDQACLTSRFEQQGRKDTWMLFIPRYRRRMRC